MPFSLSNKIYNIDIDGVTDMRRRNEYKSQYNVRIGDSADAYVSTRHSVMGEIYNISVKNVYGNGTYAVSMCKTLKDSYIGNVITGEECRVGFGFCHTHLKKSEIENVTFGNIICFITLLVASISIIIIFTLLHGFLMARYF